MRKKPRPWDVLGWRQSCLREWAYADAPMDECPDFVLGVIGVFSRDDRVREMVAARTNTPGWALASMLPSKLPYGERNSLLNAASNPNTPRKSLERTFKAAKASELDGAEVLACLARNSGAGDELLTALYDYAASEAPDGFRARIFMNLTFNSSTPMPLLLDLACKQDSSGAMSLHVLTMHGHQVVVCWSVWQHWRDRPTFLCSGRAYTRLLENLQNELGVENASLVLAGLSQAGQERYEDARAWVDGVLSTVDLEQQAIAASFVRDSGMGFEQALTAARDVLN